MPNEAKDLIFYWWYSLFVAVLSFACSDIPNRRIVSSQNYRLLEHWDVSTIAVLNFNRVRSFWKHYNIVICACLLYLLLLAHLTVDPCRNWADLSHASSRFFLCGLYGWEVEAWIQAGKLGSPPWIVPQPAPSFVSSVGLGGRRLRRTCITRVNLWRVSARTRLLKTVLPA